MLCDETMRQWTRSLQSLLPHAAVAQSVELAESNKTKLRSVEPGEVEGTTSAFALYAMQQEGEEAALRADVVSASRGGMDAGVGAGVAGAGGGSRGSSTAAAAAAAAHALLRASTSQRGAGVKRRHAGQGATVMTAASQSTHVRARSTAAGSSGGASSVLWHTFTHASVPAAQTGSCSMVCVPTKCHEVCRVLECTSESLPRLDLRRPAACFVVLKYSSASLCGVCICMCRCVD